MSNKQDIYQAPDRSKKADVDLPVVDPQTAVGRAQARRNTIGFSIFMLAVLGLAAWLFFTIDDRQTSSYEDLVEGIETGDTNEVDSGEEAGGKPGRPRINPEVVTPDLEALAAQFRDPANAGLTSLDREKLGQSMGEVRIANQYLEQKDWDLAELHALKALELWPDMPAAKRLLGFVYIQRGQFNEAVAVLENVIAREPFSAESFNNLASAYMQKWELSRAEELLTTALQIRPDFTVAHINLGLLYVIAGQYELTIDHLEQALSYAPDNVPARNNLAVALLRVGRYQDARTHLLKIAEEHPERAKTYFNIAITFVLEKDASQAMEWIRKGGSLCTPILCRTYLADSDFDPLRGHPEFMEFMRSFFPELPSLPGN